MKPKSAESSPIQECPACRGSGKNPKAWLDSYCGWFDGTFRGWMGDIVAAAFVVALSVTNAFSHTAPEGWEYSIECCHTIDCAPVPDEAVREVLGGYQITIRPGDHPMHLGDEIINALVPYDSPRVRPSGDAHKHVCMSPSGFIFCVYVPPGGV